MFNEVNALPIGPLPVKSFLSGANNFVNPDENGDPVQLDITFLNTESAFALAEGSEKPLRYSFGLSDADYKALWCRTSAIYRT